MPPSTKLPSSVVKKTKKPVEKSQPPVLTVPSNSNKRVEGNTSLFEEVYKKLDQGNKFLDEIENKKSSKKHTNTNAKANAKK